MLVRSEAQTDATASQGSTLADLYRQLSTRLVRLAFLITADAAISEDIAQEAFVRMAGRFHHLRSPEAFPAYLRRTVVNLAVSHHRRRVREEAQAQAAAAGRPQVAEFPDIELEDRLRRALRELPVRQRAAIVLRYFEDLPEREVARALRCSVPAARSLVARGMQTLREEIGGDEG